jgi:hypothetical protein
MYLALLKRYVKFSMLCGIFYNQMFCLYIYGLISRGYASILCGVF